jgi:hypothetical protein
MMTMQAVSQFPHQTRRFSVFSLGPPTSDPVKISRHVVECTTASCLGHRESESVIEHCQLISHNEGGQA